MINYTTTFYFGPRRVQTPYSNTEDIYYTHIEQLSKIKYSDITQFSFVFHSPLSENLQNNLITEINNIPVTIYHRENMGMSYGGLGHVASLNLQFPYTFFMEDDYIPKIDYFDKYFLMMMRKDTVYVCSLKTNHAAMSNGLFKTIPLIDAMNSIGGFNQIKKEYGAAEQLGQIDLYHAISKYGKTEHIADNFSLTFLHNNGEIKTHGNLNAPRIIDAIQLYGAK